MKWAVKTACTIAFRNAYGIFVADLKKKREIGRSKHRQDNNLKMHLTETECVDVGWIHLLVGQGLMMESREQNNKENFWVAQKVGNFLAS